MNEHKTGGPAFPVPGWPDDPNFNGMTLRDYFAAKAMQGAVSGGCFKSDADWKAEAEHAYGIADAMLRAREQS